jgi:peptide/nickel transport system permease protein
VLAYLARRLALAIPTLFGVLVATFGILYIIPGDPVKLLISSFESGASSPEQIAAIRAKFGLDDPLPIQFVHYVGNVFHLDFGNSILKGRPVADLILEALPNTLELAAAAMLVSITIGVGVGVLSAARRGRLTDRASIFVSLLGVSVPDFWMAIMVVLVFSVRLQWFPAFGIGGPEFLILPAAVLGVRSSSSIARLTRSSMLDVLNRQFVTTARAKGLGEVSVIGLHALKNALIPVVTLLGLEFGRLIGSAVVVETVFDRTGIGSLLVDSILGKDVPVLRATVLVIALGYVLLNLLVDLSYAWLDPRIKLA